MTFRALRMMRSRRCRARSLFTFILCTAAIVACHSRPQVNEGVRNRVVSARAQGQSTVTYSVPTPPPGVGLTFESVARNFEAVIGTIRRRNAAVTAQSQIETWHVLTVAKQTTGLPYTCTLTRPQAVRLGPQELALSTFGGTMVVDGVTITLEASAGIADLEQDRPYLFLVSLCSASVALLPIARLGIFQIDSSSSRVSPIEQSATALDRPYITRLVEIGTPEAILDALVSDRTHRR